MNAASTRAVFVDTVAWIALFNSRDDLHAAAIERRKELYRRKTPLLTTEFVLIELADAFATPPLRTSAVAVLTIEVSEGLLSSADNPSSVDTQGRFHIPVRPDAPYGFRFRAPGYPDQNLPAIFDAERGMNENVTKERFSLKAGASKDLGRIVLIKGTDIATGNRLDAAGKPISRAEILLVTPEDDWNGKTDKAGRFSFAGVVQGRRAILFAFPHEGPRTLVLQRTGLIVGAMGTLTMKPPVFAPKPKR